MILTLSVQNTITENVILTGYPLCTCVCQSTWPPTCQAVLGHRHLGQGLLEVVVPGVGLGQQLLQLPQLDVCGGLAGRTQGW